MLSAQGVPDTQIIVKPAFLTYFDYVTPVPRLLLVEELRDSLGVLADAGKRNLRAAPA